MTTKQFLDYLHDDDATCALADDLREVLAVRNGPARKSARVVPRDPRGIAS